MARNVVVTGAASGIGKSVAIAFLKEGDRVFMTDWKEDNLQAAYAELSGSGGDGMLFTQAADVSKPEEVAKVEALLKEHGGCDVLVNCAAVFGWVPSMTPPWLTMIFNLTSMYGVYSIQQGADPPTCSQRKRARWSM